MAIENSKKRDSVVKISMRDVRVLHRSAPALHAHCHEADLIYTERVVRRRGGILVGHANNDMDLHCFARLSEFALSVA